MLLGVSTLLLIGAALVAFWPEREAGRAPAPRVAIESAPLREEARPDSTEPSAPPVQVPSAPAPAAEAPVAASRQFSADPTTLIRELEPMMREVSTGLEDLDVRGGCVAGDARVVVTLESADGAVWVLDAEVTAVLHEVVANPGDTGRDYQPGDVDAAGARCMVEAFRGKKIIAPSALPGRRWTMSYEPLRRG